MEKSDIDDLITRYPILSTFEEPDVTRIIDESRIARFSKGTMLRDRKESVDSVVFVKEGMLRVYTNDGDKQVLCSRRSAKRDDGSKDLSKPGDRLSYRDGDGLSTLYASG